MTSALKSILITGAASGIGFDAAQTLQSKGWRVFASCRQKADAERLMANGFPDAIHLDYEDPDSITAAVNHVLTSTGGSLDALFNNGAYAIPGPIEDLSRAAMTASLNANFLGWHDLTVQLLPAMRAQGHGRVVNCSSVLGLVATPYRGAYCASKFAVEAWSDALRMEMVDAGIFVSLIEPGPIVTKFRANAVKRFEQWVDWENSLRVEEYRTGLLDRVYKGSGNSPFSKPASAVTAKLIHAIESPRPKARYFVTVPTYGADVLRRLLPTSLLDQVMKRG
ncbi:MAG: NAD(P)-dependent dehydrogenase (short-subunit alcohol dehydrogenase family) [Kiritimatiellia bacterium]|jgi:NAD(P)-dependent dehydrogenase (short-subunit alcohol dehydrogenase family)